MSVFGGLTTQRWDPDLSQRDVSPVRRTRFVRVVVSESRGG